MQVVNYNTIEKSLYYEGTFSNKQVFNIHSIFDNIPLIKCLVVIEPQGDTNIDIEVAYNNVNNITETYKINYNEIAFFEISNPNNAFISVNGSYRIKIKAFRI